MEMEGKSRTELKSEMGANLSKLKTFHGLSFELVLRDVSIHQLNDRKDVVMSTLIYQNQTKNEKKANVQRPRTTVKLFWFFTLYPVI